MSIKQLCESSSFNNRETFCWFIFKTSSAHHNTLWTTDPFNLRVQMMVINFFHISTFSKTDSIVFIILVLTFQYMEFNWIEAAAGSFNSKAKWQVFLFSDLFRWMRQQSCARIHLLPCQVHLTPIFTWNDRNGRTVHNNMLFSDIIVHFVGHRCETN